MQNIQTGKQTNYGSPFIPPTDQRVVFHSHVAANSRVKDQILKNVEHFKQVGGVQEAINFQQPRAIITNRMRELDIEWDVERTLQFLHATLSIGFMMLGAFYNSFFYFMSFCVNVFLLQHSLQVLKKLST